MKQSKLFLIVVIIIAVTLFYLNVGSEYLSLSFLKEKLVDFQTYYKTYPVSVILIYFLIYVIATAFSFPGAVVLTLLGGALFGSWVGLIIVSFASSLGSLVAFFISRFLLRNFFVSKFQKQFGIIDQKLANEGALYLASLRLIPVFPFFMINIVMGLTKINAWTFYWVSQVAMLPGTAVFVFAGKEFSQISSLKGILSPGIILAFTLLGLLPLIGKFIFNQISKNKVYKKFQRPKSFDYNLVAIGGGSAGLVTSYIGAMVKSKVGLIEKHKMGGDCLNTGCVPSKALIKSAKIVHYQKRAHEFGLNNISVDFNFSDIMEHVQNVIKEIEPHDSVKRYQAIGVDCLVGEAKILDPWTIELNGKKITTQNIVIATGARPFIPNIPGIKEAKYVTSDNLWGLRSLPKKFVVLGGGPIGVEMAQAFARFGSEVTLIEGSDRILNKEDPQVSILLTKTLQAEGIKVLTSHKVIAFKNDDELQLICEYQSQNIALNYDLALVAVGRKANTQGFGMEELGIRLRKNGTIDANEYLQSNFPNIYACGDVTGPYQLTHMASHQAWYCAVNSLSPKKFKVDYSVVPWCTYSDPEVATVGENETSAREKGLDFDVSEYELSDLDRAITDGEKIGMIRVITLKGKDQILGATIVGTQASIMIMEFVSAMKNKKGMNSILGTIHVYPSFGEANKYVAGVWKRSQVNEKILNLLQKYFKWLRN